MTKFKGKWVLPVVLVIILVFSYFSLYGYRTQYADIVTTHIPGITGVNGGRTLDGTADITFYPDAGQNVDDAALNKSAEIMKARLYQNYNISDCDIFIDYTAKTITVQYAWDGEAEENAPVAVAQELGGKGFMTMRAGTNETDSVILDSSHLSSAKLTKNDGVTYVSYYFNDEGAELLKNATTEYKDSTISLWIDSVCKIRISVTETITDGFFTIKSSETEQGSKAIVNTLSMEQLPVSFTPYDYSYAEAEIGSNGGLMMLIALILFFVVICVVLIAKYKMPGFAASAALLGYIAFFIAAVSGMFSTLSGFNLNVSSFVAFALTVGLLIYTMLTAIRAVKAKVNSGMSVRSAFKDSSANTFWKSIYFNIFFLLLGFTIYGMFGFKPAFAANVFGPISSFLGLHGSIAVTEFASIMMFGVLGNVIFGIIIFRLMLISVRGSKYFVPSEGGKNNDK